MASRENFELLKQTVVSTKYDIFTISESWLDLMICDADIEISGYKMFRQDRGTHKRGGGLVVYGKKHLQGLCDRKMVLSVSIQFSTTIVESTV